jgi:hypothetical protein
MVARQLGLTALYNQMHHAEVHDQAIARLRELHVEIDQSVAEAYGWDDLRLDHGFHQTEQGTRFSISPPARREVLRRLLELNHQRYADEIARGVAVGKSPRNGHHPGQMELVEA